ncbi:MAG TPA: SRPBCC family protein [Thermoleophilaceae bacterium]|nr:SRPBCC family protein [Thermoleophilaceae bacterium]
MKIERTIEIDAPREEVYAVCMDPERLADWVTIHVGVKDAPDTLERGSTMTQCLKLAGKRFDVRWKVVKDDSPQRVVWEGEGPVHSKAQVVYEFEENGNGGTRFSYMNHYDLPGGVLGRIGARAVEPLSARESERSLERLKRLLES